MCVFFVEYLNFFFGLRMLWKLIKPILKTKRRKIQQNHCSLSPQVLGAILGALLYRGISSDLQQTRPKQSHHLPGALLHWWLQAANSLQWVVPTFNFTTLVHRFAICVHLFEYILKGMLIKTRTTKTRGGGVRLTPVVNTVMGRTSVKLALN